MAFAALFLLYESRTDGSYGMNPGCFLATSYYRVCCFKETIGFLKTLLCHPQVILHAFLLYVGWDGVVVERNCKKQADSGQHFTSVTFNLASFVLLIDAAPGASAVDLAFYFQRETSTMEGAFLSLLD